VDALVAAGQTTQADLVSLVNAAEDAVVRSVERLVDLGLAWESLPDDQVDDRAMELARRCTDPELVRAAMQTFRAQNASRQLPWHSALKAEQAVQIWSMGRKA
jgi:enoyl-CoA hydratase/carnithine racemase